MHSGEIGEIDSWEELHGLAASCGEASSPKTSKGSVGVGAKGKGWKGTAKAKAAPQEEPSSGVSWKGGKVGTAKGRQILLPSA